ncbi:hypothetical protein LR48_Vigan10g215600 [Vigna angularis]|uniref:Oxidoreductase molybdopterin-binding domain-containing protein n=1 Tax=Phaseolus angularis TaxID=3914 RepID=A0A0L9VND2_PHAAN|nr:hypothetical protein LR48_Vigan10g215600 [Vigna angularis]
MPGLTAPSDYSQEPPRHPSLLINAKASQFTIPFSLRVSQFFQTLITNRRRVFPFSVSDAIQCGATAFCLGCLLCHPLRFLLQEESRSDTHRRGHKQFGNLQTNAVDAATIVSWCKATIVVLLHSLHRGIRNKGGRCSLNYGCVEVTKTPKIDIVAVMLPKYNVTATLQCAGNRRTAMSKTKTVRGVGWNVSAIGNAIWGGAKLSDVLELVGIPKLTSVTQFGGRHVEFVSVDKCKEENGGPYKASIPLSQATNPEADVLLAYEMNGEVSGFDYAIFLQH